MIPGLEKSLRAAGLRPRRIEHGGDTGFMLDSIDDSSAVSGITGSEGLFLIAERNAEKLLAAAAPGAQVVESGILRLGDAEVPIHRCLPVLRPQGKKVREGAENLSRRAAWMRKRTR